MIKIMYVYKDFVIEISDAVYVIDDNNKTKHTDEETARKFINKQYN